jgi:TetR/AcrR family fatty acid metabolism transcriptional regulator
MTPEIIAADPAWPYTKAKTAVLAAAAAVIREEGPRAATLKNISNRAGITEPAIFRHFEGVDGLFGGLFHAYERVYQRFAEVYKVEERGIKRLRSATTSIVEYLDAAKDFAYILIHAEQVFRGYPDLRRRITEYKQKDQENALSCIVEGVERGEIRGDVDPLSLASISVGVIYLTVVTWLDSGFAFDLKEVCGHRWVDFERLLSPAAAGKRKPARAHPVPFKPSRSATRVLTSAKLVPVKGGSAKAKAPPKGKAKQAAKPAPRVKASAKATPRGKAADAAKTRAAKTPAVGRAASVKKKK